MSSEPKSTGDRLRAAATGQQLAKKEPSSFPQMLTAYKSQIALALPKHITGDRMLRVALTAFRQNPKLAECDPKSVFAAIIIGAQLGLEPGVLGQAYLVPYKTECQFIPGWQGLCDLVNRSGRASVWTGAVFDGDYFEYEYGSNPRIVHRSAGNDDQPDKLTHCYAVGRVKGAEFPVIEVWSVPKIIRHRDLYNKVGNKHYSYKNFEMYGRKVPLLQVLKYMPKSIELATALDLDHASNVGQVVSVQEAIEGAFMPTPVADVDQATGEITYEVPDTLPAQMKFIKEATDLDDLKVRYVAASQRHDSVPVDLEAARNERADAIRSRDEKAKA